MKRAHYSLTQIEYRLSLSIIIMKQNLVLKDESEYDLFTLSVSHYRGTEELLCLYS